MLGNRVGSVVMAFYTDFIEHEENGFMKIICVAALHDNCWCHKCRAKEKDMIKREDIFGEEGPVIHPENPDDARFMYVYTACLKQFLEEIKGLGQDNINALFNKYKVQMGGRGGKPCVAIEFPGGVPPRIQEAAKEYGKRFKK